MRRRIAVCWQVTDGHLDLAEIVQLRLDLELCVKWSCGLVVDAALKGNIVGRTYWVSMKQTACSDAVAAALRHHLPGNLRAPLRLLDAATVATAAGRPMHPSVAKLVLGSPFFRTDELVKRTLIPPKLNYSAVILTFIYLF